MTEIFIPYRTVLRISDPTIPSENWTAYVTSVDHDKNELRVILQNAHHRWQEGWNLDHTFTGVKSGYYVYAVLRDGTSESLIETWPMIRFSQFVDWVNGFSGERPAELQLGQWAFNLLHDSYPGLASHLRGRAMDPWVDTKRLPMCLAFILRHYVVMDEEVLANARPANGSGS